MSTGMREGTEERKEDLGGGPWRSVQGIWEVRVQAVLSKTCLEKTAVDEVSRG